MKVVFCFCLLAAILNHPSESFAPSSRRPSFHRRQQQRHHHYRMREDTTRQPSSIPVSALLVHNVRDADMYEMMVGGERYEMVRLPDSMLQTTLFVGNLNEFVSDNDLSELFAPITEWSSVPACVCRKPNMASLKYGFVTFPSEAQKEEALVRFHNTELKGNTIKVEEIRDHPKTGRVRVPEKMVAYVIGGVKSRSRNGQLNTMRRVSNPAELQKKRKKVKSKRKMSYNKVTTQKQDQYDYPLSKAQDSDSERAENLDNSALSSKQQQQQAKKKKKRKLQQKKVEKYKLSSKEQQEFQRALRKGYVTLDGTGFRRGRKSSNLACAHRQWCDLQFDPKPQIVLCKASGGRPLDCLIVDLSPTLRERRLSSPSLIGNGGDDVEEEDGEFLVGSDGEGEGDDDVIGWWNGPIAKAAENAGMILRSDYEQDNTQTELRRDQLDLPISQLPAISMGVFEGERSKAKAMARELADLWELRSIAEPTVTSSSPSSSSPSPSRTRMDCNSRHRDARSNKKHRKSKSCKDDASSSNKRRQQRRQRRRRENDFSSSPLYVSFFQ